MPKFDELTKNEHELLVAIAQSINASTGRKPPRTKDLARQMSKVNSAISNPKANLRKKGFLDETGFLTEKAHAYLERVLVIVPVHLPLVGKVQAGYRSQDELEVIIKNVEELNDPDVPTITIPATANLENVVALTVVGISMVDEHIFDGDILLVHIFNDREEASHGQLIIAQYLSKKDEPYVDLEELANGGNVPDEFLEGPTVKYYYQFAGHYRLSIRKNHANNPHTIETRYVKPIGRVIGAYRSIT